MNFNSTKVLLANCMVIGVTMSICSNNWISMWMGLEVSILSFIPFIQNNNSNNEESSIKYFIIQSVASACFMLGVIIMLIGVSMINFSTLMTMAMLVKIGVAPFHNWVLMIIESLNYKVLLVLITIMKMPPLTILSYSSVNMYLPILISLTLSSIWCLNQTSMKKIIAYSSIFNMGMVLMSMQMNIVWINFMMLYSTMSMLITWTLNFSKINFINQIIMNEYNPTVKLNIWVNMLSMGGLPPLLGFFTKIMIIQIIINESNWILLANLICCSLLVMSFYLRLAFTSMFFFNLLKKWEMKYSAFSYWCLWMNITSPMLMYLKSL
uniref:NADH-ubiquinone oxidoreductase chain 2 n=1 Tax=Cicadellidae sp. 'Neodcortus squaras' TaxID=2901392 RepID=A0A8K2ATV3_9HEMI|nr:NADH dehydrogenase subunit 2 [Cicadellidae sp. 'Neodcortus squaras']